MASTRPELTEPFRDGRKARKSGFGRYFCPYPINQMRAHSLWLCGWHTADMELSA